METRTIPKQIEVRSVRLCCEPQDKQERKLSTVLQCRYCGMYYIERRFTDAAGSVDSEFIPCPLDMAKQTSHLEIEKWV